MGTFVDINTKDDEVCLDYSFRYKNAWFIGCKGTCRFLLLRLDIDRGIQLCNMAEDSNPGQFCRFCARIQRLFVPVGRGLYVYTG